LERTTQEPVATLNRPGISGDSHGGAGGLSLDHMPRLGKAPSPSTKCSLEKGMLLQIFYKTSRETGSHTLLACRVGLDALQHVAEVGSETASFEFVPRGVPPFVPPP
jgi:hypothetical protein